MWYTSRYLTQHSTETQAIACICLYCYAPFQDVLRSYKYQWECLMTTHSSMCNVYLEFLPRFIITDIWKVEKRKSMESFYSRHVGKKYYFILKNEKMYSFTLYTFETWLYILEHGFLSREISSKESRQHGDTCSVKKTILPWL